VSALTPPGPRSRAALLDIDITQETRERAGLVSRRQPNLSISACVLHDGPLFCDSIAVREIAQLLHLISEARKYSSATTGT
jgi:hypothetical protein